MNAIEEAQKTIDREKASAVTACPWYPGDVVRHDGRLWRITHVSFNDFFKPPSVVVSARNNSTTMIGWSGNTAVWKPDQWSKLTAAEEPYEEHHWGEHVNKVRELATFQATIEGIRAEMRELQQAIHTERLEHCLHDWDEGCETGETRKHLMGETDVMVYTCQLCGIEGRNC